jgi:DNA-binding NtrC family response regulator
VRELENFVKRIVVLGSEDLVMQELVARGAGLTAAGGVAATRAPPAPVLDPARALAVPRPALAWVPGIGLKEVGRHAAREAERDVIQQVLEEVRWNRMEAARRLKISYKALLYKIRMYDLGTFPPGKSAA